MNMTQTKLAELSGIKQTLISSYCTGRHVPSIETRIKLAQVLEIDESEVTQYLRSITFDKGKRRSTVNGISKNASDIYPVKYNADAVAEAFVRAIKLYARYTSQQEWKGVGYIDPAELDEQTNTTLIFVEDDPHEYLYTPDQIAVNSILQHGTNEDHKVHIADVLIRINNRNIATMITDLLNNTKVFANADGSIL